MNFHEFFSEIEEIEQKFSDKGLDTAKVDVCLWFRDKLTNVNLIIDNTDQQGDPHIIID